MVATNLNSYVILSNVHRSTCSQNNGYLHACACTFTRTRSGEPFSEPTNGHIGVSHHTRYYNSLILSAEDQIWICKPSCSNQGRGIFLLKNPASVTTLQATLRGAEERPLKKRVPHKAPQARIVQR